MKLEIKLKGRELEYRADAESGNTLKSLIEVSKDPNINEIVISGESKSYTSLRQIALFVNLLQDKKSIAVTLKSASFIKKGDFILPLYE